MLIALVGCDGSGKSTQIELLTPWIETTFEKRVRLISKKNIFDFDHFPDSRRLFGCSYRDLMYDIVPNMKAESRALFLFFMFALSTCNYPPRTDEVVLLDGGWYKHFATEAAMGVDYAWLRKVGSFFPKPEITFFLDIDPTVVVQRRHHNAYGPHAPYECGCQQVTDEGFIANMSKAVAHLKTMAKADGWINVNGDLPRQEIFEILKRILGERFTRSRP